MRNMSEIARHVNEMMGVKNSFTSAGNALELSLFGSDANFDLRTRHNSRVRYPRC